MHRDDLKKLQLAKQYLDKGDTRVVAILINDIIKANTKDRVIPIRDIRDKEEYAKVRTLISENQN